MKKNIIYINPKIYYEMLSERVMKVQGFMGSCYEAYDEVLFS